VELRDQLQEFGERVSNRQSYRRDRHCTGAKEKEIAERVAL